MNALCGLTFVFILNLDTVALATSRLQTFCVAQSGQWFPISQTCVVLSTSTYNWNDGWDYCASYVDSSNASDTISGRLAQAVNETERQQLLTYASTAISPFVYIGIGAFITGSQNAADWNWCDTKNCGRDGGQPKHPLNIDMTGVTLNSGDCGAMEKNKQPINDASCTGVARAVACQYFLQNTQTCCSNTNNRIAHYKKLNSTATRTPLRQYLNLPVAKQCASQCYNFIGCAGYLFGSNGNCTLLGGISSNSSTMVNAYIDQFL